MYYKTNFLKNVIFRLDFDGIKELENDQTPDLTTLISEKYNAPLKKVVKTLQVLISPDGDKKFEDNTSWVWEYQQTNSANKIVSLAKNSLIFECREFEYKNISSFKDDIEFIFSKFQQKYEVKQYNRCGLRYINEIFVPGKNPVKWDGFINPDLCKAIEAGLLPNSQPVRSMHQLQVKKDEITILFNYGIFNKDYPNPIAKPELILDYDYYINATLDKGEVLEKLIELNALADEMFNFSISDKLIAIMEPC